MRAQQLTLRLERLALGLRRKVASRLGGRREVYFGQRVAQYRELWRAAAGELGARFAELAPDLWEVSLGECRTRIHSYKLEFDDPVTLDLVGRKPLVHRLLREHEIPVPRHRAFDLARLPDAERFLREHGAACVVKPAGGYGGRGVTTHVRDRRGLRRAALLASLESRELLIEAQIPGECFRVLVLEGRAVHAVRRSGCRVQGDGSATIRELWRRTGPTAPGDRDADFTLSAQALSWDDVPPPGASVLVKSLPARACLRAELRTVYDADVTDRVHASLFRAAERATRAVGAELAGVDFITPDAEVSLAESGGVVNEVNTTPALHHHYDAGQQSHPPVAALVLGRALAKAGRDRLPEAA